MRLSVAPLILASWTILSFAGCGPSDTAEISITEFLEHKRTGKIKEIWIEGDENGGVVLGEIHVGYIRDGLQYKYVRASIPPGHISDPTSFEKLTEHIEPSRVHYSKP